MSGSRISVSAGVETAGTAGAQVTGAAVAVSPVQTRPRPSSSRTCGWAIEEFVLEIIEGVLIQLKLPLEGAIGHPATPLQHGHRLVQYLLKGHPPSSRWLGAPQPQQETSSCAHLS